MSRREPMVLQESDFEVMGTSGGKTGSVQVVYLLDNKLYQLKPSILNNSYPRQFKAKFTDRENFGEAIAAGLLVEIADTGSIPEVFLVYVSCTPKTRQGLKRVFDQYRINSIVERTHEKETQSCLQVQSSVRSPERASYCRNLS